MNNLTKILITLGLVLFTYQASADYKCEIKTNDVGNFQHKANTLKKAMLVTSTECFDARIDLFVKNRNAFPNLNQGRLIIDACVNANKCGVK